MKVSPLGNEDGWTDRHNEANNCFS